MHACVKPVTTLPATATLAKLPVALPWEPAAGRRSERLEGLPAEPYSGTREEEPPSGQPEARRRA